MKTLTLKKGLDIPAQGEPRQEIRQGKKVTRIALVGDDYIGLKPTMLVKEGDRVALGQPLFTDKKNPAVLFTAPGSGRVEAIHRGAKRKFLSLVISLEGEEEKDFSELIPKSPQAAPPAVLREVLLESGLWTAFRTRPYGKVAGGNDTPSSLFVTALDTNPLAADPLVILENQRELFKQGLAVVKHMLDVPVHLCMRPTAKATEGGAELEGVEMWGIEGPHPAGLPSTHIHFIDPVQAGKQVWHICYQDVIRIGHLFTHGRLSVEQIVALGGEGFVDPSLVRTRMGASLDELCAEEIDTKSEWRLLSGSILDGRIKDQETGFLGRYHRQVSVLEEGDGSSLLGWVVPGKKRFSITGLFTSALSSPGSRFPFLTALWGGKRAIYPLDVYDRVMPMDILPLPLLKSLAVKDTEKSSALGCLELIEEDLALCSFVCPGKNDFGPMLREVLNTIEKEG
ncbi:MAG: NADH:ubiquinone reductase (Na(+)-transporting) subunit A [Desulfobulbus propionicus]|nr:MAG: NADH:ubiquinone reductase (Na(+)-transporting) subunit A [Desulfobulbus propionicus]PIE63865.1 MAG: NADH:ubiquinone reductase (Na(+)-transporting) subunit A [Desulfobacterales bacterium]